MQVKANNGASPTKSQIPKMIHNFPIKKELFLELVFISFFFFKHLPRDSNR